MKDFKMPVAVITFLAAQAGGMVWFLSGMEGRVKTLEGKRLGDVEMIAKENRRYIREVIQPSYNISDAWAYEGGTKQKNFEELREIRRSFGTLDAG